MVTTTKIEAKTVAEAAAKVYEIHDEFGKNVNIALSILAGDDNAERAELLGYAFTWLKNNLNIEDNVKIKLEPSRMTGAIEFTDFAGIGDQPQKIASAASAIETSELTGASYKPILFVGTQSVRGVNYWFFAEQTRSTNPPKKKIVTIAVNEFQGKFEIVNGSVHEIKFEISR